MSSKISFAAGESFSEDLRRVLREQSGKCQKSLSAKKVGESEVHDARKRCKKMRSTSRLARPGMKSGVFETENGVLREAKNRLETLRHREVLVQTVEGLREDFNDVLTSTAFAQLEAHLRQKKAEAAADEELVTEQPQEALREIRAFEKRIDDVIPDEIDFDDACDGLKKIYKQAQKRMKKAQKKSSPENIHDWRKRVKDLSYQLRLLRNLWPNQLGKLAKATKELSEHLGNDHDLAELSGYVQETADCCAGPQERSALQALIRRRRKELQAKAWPLGYRIFAEKPGDFVDRLKKYHKARQLETR